MVVLVVWHEPLSTQKSPFNTAGNFFSISGNLNHETGNYQTRSWIPSLAEEVDHLLHLSHTRLHHEELMITV